MISDSFQDPCSCKDHFFPGASCPFARRVFLWRPTIRWGSSPRALLASKRIHHWVSGHGPARIEVCWSEFILNASWSCQECIQKKCDQRVGEHCCRICSKKEFVRWRSVSLLLTIWRFTRNDPSKAGPQELLIQPGLDGITNIEVDRTEMLYLDFFHYSSRSCQMWRTDFVMTRFLLSWTSFRKLVGVRKRNEVGRNSLFGPCSWFSIPNKCPLFGQKWDELFSRLLCW